MPHAVYVIQRLMSAAPRKLQLVTEERRVVKGHEATHAPQHATAIGARRPLLGCRWLDQRFEHLECGDLDAVTESEFVASRKFLNGRQKPHQKLIVRLDRCARALGIFRHRDHSLEKFDHGRCPWTQEVRR